MQLLFFNKHCAYCNYCNMNVLTLDDAFAKGGQVLRICIRCSGGQLQLCSQGLTFLQQGTVGTKLPTAAY